MQTITYTSARANLAKTMDKICEDHTPIVVNRAGAQPIVMISLEDFESMEETQYLLKSPANAVRLVSAIDEIEAMIADKKSSKIRKKSAKK